MCPICFHDAFLTIALSPISWQRQPCFPRGDTSPLWAEEHTRFSLQTGWSVQRHTSEADKSVGLKIL